MGAEPFSWNESLGAEIRERRSKHAKLRVPVQEMQQEIFNGLECKGTRGGQIQMPQMRQPQKPTCFWHFLRQNLEKGLSLPLDVKGAARLLNRPRLLTEKGRFQSWIILALSVFFFLSVFAGTCSYLHDPLPESQKVSQVFDADEKIIVKAITRVLKDHSFGTPRVEADNSRLETDYVVEGDWRTKVVVTLEKISPKKREVTLSVVTEKKSSSQWQPQKLMGKEQYDKLFGEIEMQIYRELYERQ